VAEIVETESHVDLHTNLFWSYGNPALEDNCTRALMIALRTCGDDVIRRFLWKFAAIRGDGHLQVALQAAPSSRTVPAKATILAITAGPDSARVRRTLEDRGLEKKLRAAHHDGSRPDGWIFNDEEVLLLVESKLGSAVDRDQLSRHSRRWLERPLPARYPTTSWKEIAGFFDEIGRGPGGTPDRFVARQFVAYLDLMGLVDFECFREHHFELKEYQEGFKSLIAEMKRTRGFRGKWKVHRWNEPDSSFFRGGGLGNTGLALWDSGEFLSVKLAIGASSKDETAALLECQERPEWRARITRALRDLGRFTAEVKIRAQLASASNYVTVSRHEGVTAQALAAILDDLERCHLDKRVSRRSLVRWLQKQGVDKGEIRERLDRHKHFNVYGHLLLYTQIPQEKIIGVPLPRLARDLARRLEAMERVRAVMTADAGD
jgi:hypothetical protein